MTPFGDLSLIKDRPGSNRVERIVAGVSTIFLIGYPPRLLSCSTWYVYIKENSETCLYEEQVKR